MDTRKQGRVRFNGLFLSPRSTARRDREMADTPRAPYVEDVHASDNNTRNQVERLHYRPDARGVARYQLFGGSSPDRVGTIDAISRVLATCRWELCNGDTRNYGGHGHAVTRPGFVVHPSTKPHDT